MTRKQKVRDKYWDEKHPKNDIDFIEVSLRDETLDSFIKFYGAERFFEPVVDAEEQARAKKRKERLVNKIFKAASIALTDRQFQIFTLRYALGLKEMNIAAQVGVNQSYVAAVLKASHHKIKKIMRLKVKNRNATKVKPPKDTTIDVNTLIPVEKST